MHSLSVCVCVHKLYHIVSPLVMDSAYVSAALCHCSRQMDPEFSLNWLYFFFLRSLL